MRSRIFLKALAAFLLVIQIITPTHVSAKADQAVIVVRIYYQTQENLDDFASKLDVWQVNMMEGYLIAAVDQQTLEDLISLGFDVVIESRLTASLENFQQASPARSGVAGYTCYRTVEETFASAAAIAAQYPQLASWEDIGDSWKKTDTAGQAGYDMMVLVLTNKGVGGDKPKILITSAIHAREMSTAEITMRFAELLVSQYGFDPDITWLLDYQEVHLVFHANPDGRKQAETGLLWRKNTNENYCGATSTSRGADLNRNFDFKWGVSGSGDSPCDSNYMGPVAASEPETQAIQNYMAAEFPDQRGEDINDPAPDDAMGVYLDIHSYGSEILFPWGWGLQDAPNKVQLKTFGSKMAYYSGYNAHQAAGMYPASGATDDYSYGILGLAGYTIEVGTNFFQSCGSFEYDVLNDNLLLLLYAAKVSRAPYMLPSGPETIHVTVSDAGVVVGDTVILQAVVDDSRYKDSYNEPPEPVQTIAAAEYYLDIPPWETGAVAHSLSAEDGAFDDVSESVQVSVDTTGWSPGRHILYLRGQDADGNWGVVSAVFVSVVDPASAAIVSGIVTAGDTGLPLAAQVTLQDFETTAESVSGAYNLSVPGGHYGLVIDHPDYGVYRVDDLLLTDGEVLTVDVTLMPRCRVFYDPVELSDAAWVPEGSWAITDVSAHSPGHAWTDSPGSNYGAWLRQSLTSTAFDFSDKTSVQFSFWHHYDLEADFDFGLVQYSLDGDVWQTLEAFTGDGELIWRQASYDLSFLDGEPEVYLRFQIETDDETFGDGWTIDDIQLHAGCSACLQTGLYYFPIVE